MDDDLDIWELRHGDTLIGTFTVTDQDMFWFSATFEPTAAFQQYKPLFDEDSNLGSDDAAIEKSNDLQQEINDLGLYLIRPRDGERSSLMILHINRDNTAGFRVI